MIVSFDRLNREEEGGREKAQSGDGDGGMGPWAFGVSIVLVSALGLLLNAYVLLVVLGLGKQVGKHEDLRNFYDNDGFFPLL